MKKNIFLLLLFLFSIMAACTKDSPTPEIDQEELGAANLIFTPVVKNGEQNSYIPIPNEEVVTLSFKGNPLLPPVGEHIHLTTGMTYKMELVSFDFAGREVQHTFIQRADTHQAFLLNAPVNSLSLEYGDDQVGVTSYITIKEDMEVTLLRFVMRHLNTGVKSRIKASDWNNKDYDQYTGANDLDLKFEAHFSSEEHAH